MPNFDTESRHAAEVLLARLDAGDIDEVRKMLHAVIEHSSDSAVDGLPQAAYNLYLGPDVWRRSGPRGRDHNQVCALGSGFERAVSDWAESRSGVSVELSELSKVFSTRTDVLRQVQDTLVQCNYQPFVPQEPAKLPPSVESTDEGTSPALSLVITELLRTQAARASTAERVERRLIWAARAAGLTQREIASSIGKPQTYVHRNLRATTDDPSSASVTPKEIYDNFLAGGVDRAEMLALLAAYPYEAGSFPEDARGWGYVPGSVDELTELVLDGALSREEFETILVAMEGLKHRPDDD